MMMDLGPHAGYIITAYLGVAAVVLGLIAAVTLNARAKRTKLAALDARRKPETKA